MDSEIVKISPIMDKDDILVEFTKRYKNGSAFTSCVFCTRKTTSRDGFHYSCYLNATDREIRLVNACLQDAMPISLVGA